MNNPELLAPAGNLKKLKYAIEFGADAVYCGIPDFSLRTRINQFDLDSLKTGIEYAHERGKKVYVTVNIFAHNKHLEKLPEYLKQLGTLKPDALIISDPGIIEIVKEILPNMEIHLSTQANCTNWRAVKFWHEQGIKRIILGREVTLDEIKEIHKKVPEAELECFVHGAMCMSYSGRCILSKYFTDKSANLGDCTQPCRWQYNIFKKTKNQKIKKSNTVSNNFYLAEVKRPNDFLPIEEDQHGTYILNSKDLCLIDYLEDLKNAGIMSFKIEGRAKSIYYLSNVVKAYRQAIDNPNVRYRHACTLQKLQNREYTSGFLFGKEKCEQKTDTTHADCNWIFVGEVVATNNPPFTKRKLKVNFTSIRVHNELNIGDKIECVPPKGENFEIEIEKMIDGETGEENNEAHGGQNKIVLIECKEKNIPMMSILRKNLSI